MNEARNTVLVVEDQKINRKIVCNLLKDTYPTIEAENGLEAIEALKNNKNIGTILLDLVMPVMNGFEFMEKLKEMGQSAIPVIVMTGSDDRETESIALKAGAIDFVRKPIYKDILLSRTENAMIRNQMVMLERMQFLASHDTLTKLYNRNKMFDVTRKLLDNDRSRQFTFVRFDIDKFRMYNTAMGEAEGDCLLKYIGDLVRNTAAAFGECTYGRIDADVFCLCVPNDEQAILYYMEAAERELSKYRTDYPIESKFGLYVIDDPSLSVETIYTRASMASNKCKGIYDVHYAYYESSMTEQVNLEQRITNEMRSALDEEQFVVYLQPKYDLNTDLPCGAEALVRWNHPKNGLVSPGVFIPVFEKNGFIATLDYYMWEHVCMLLHKWISAGKNAYPVSVNMSRISLFNPNVDKLINDLTEKYQIPHHLLNLEVTESAYMSNPELMKVTIDKLQKSGFTILMDDFGSGYSSLNTLKQINIDVLKLDMKFMPNGDDMGKSEKILSSIVRMAGWLGMDVIAEGVETIEQRDFLVSIGCGYVQGYYYAKPMPIDEYEALLEKCSPSNFMKSNETEVITSAIWSSSTQIGEILSSIDAPVAVFEYTGGHIELVRSNELFIKLYGNESMNQLHTNLSMEDEMKVKQTLGRTAKTGFSSYCEFSFISVDGHSHWLRMKTRRIAEIPKSAIICCLFEEITKEKIYESRFNRFIEIFESESNKKKILVIDDALVSRAVLNEMFREEYDILEASNGIEGIRMLKENMYDIAAILLDLVMPEMDGQTFLKEKNNIPEASTIPVVVISAENDSSVQLGMLKNGVSDYVIKPFDYELTHQRVANAISYQSRFKRLVEEYKNVADDI